MSDELTLLSGSSSAEATPAELFGPLLARVQESGVLADGKAFVDAVPTRPVADILEAFARLPGGDEALRAFLDANFELPAPIMAAVATKPTLPLRAYIRTMWRSLEREADPAAPNSSALPLDHPHLVPGGRFREIYYWDSFFSLLGLVRDREDRLAAGIVDAMTDLIERYGYVPNGTRTYYLGRSQPPVYHLMVDLLGAGDQPHGARRLRAMKREHGWWMKGAGEVQSGEQLARVARLADGSIVNRYWDASATPRDESWREDVATARASMRADGEVFRALRAGAESGWDFSSRWLDDDTLASIRTPTIAPVDLNAFLYGLERAIAERGDEDDAVVYGEMADARRTSLHRNFWNEAGGYFTDHDLESGSLRIQSSAAALTPLLVGAATQDQADATARFIGGSYLAKGGLRTTLIQSGQQWDRPNGWAPLQWIAVAGLRRYGHDILARTIAARWVATVEQTYEAHGLIYEKYDVETGDIGIGGEYASQTGFGWTNGVTADFIDSLDRS